jgi:hypothetical protein
VASEEYFEYADVLDAVSDYSRPKRSRKQQSRKFAFVEIGSGYGHWTFTAHKALMQKMPQASYKYLMVDVVNELKPVIERLAFWNGVDRTSMSFHAGLVGAVGDDERDRKNEESQHNTYAADWGVKAEAQHVAARPISLSVLLDTYGMPCELDMVDVDIQGAEYTLLVDNATVDLLTARAHRVHIGTHSNIHADRDIQRRFHERGWATLWSFENACCEKDGAPSPVGPISFNDGVLSLVNRNPIRCED